MGKKKNLHTRCPTSSCCFMKGQNKQDKICLIHSSKETGVRNVTHPSPSNSTMWPGAAQPRTETPEAGAPAVPERQEFPTSQVGRPAPPTIILG